MKPDINPPGRSGKVFLCILFLVFADIFVFKSTLHNGFISEDFLYLQIASRAINSHDYMQVFKPSYIRGIHPLVVFMFIACFKAFQLNILVFRGIILLFHTGSCIFFFLLCIILFSRQRFSRKHEWAVLAALFFTTAYPHHEAVLYLSSVAEVMYTFFALLSVTCFLHSLNARKPSYYFISLIAFLLSLLSKEPAVILPFLMFFCILFLWADGRLGTASRFKMSLKTTMPFFIIMIAYAIPYCISFYFFLPASLAQNGPGNFLHFPLTLFVWIPLWFANFFPVASESFFYMREQRLFIFLWLAYALQFVLLVSVILFLVIFIANKYKKQPEAYPLYVFSLVWIFFSLIPCTVMMRGYTGDLKENIFPSRYYYFSSAGFSLLLALSVRMLAETFTRISRFLKLFYLVPAGLILVNILFFQFRETQYHDRGFILQWLFSSVSVMTDHLTKPAVVVLVDFPDDVMDVRDLQNLIFLVHGRQKVVSAGNKRNLERYLCGKEEAKKLFYLEYNEKNIAVDKTTSYREHLSSCWGNF